MNYKGKNRRAVSGMTLVEMLVSIVIFAFMAATLYTGFLAAQTTWQVYKGNIRTQREARKALIQISRELREAQSVAIVKTTGTVTLSFGRPDHGTVTYLWSDSGDNADQIRRIEEVVPKIVANNISFCDFTDLTGSVLIELTARDDTQSGETIYYNLKEKIALRQD